MEMNIQKYMAFVRTVEEGSFTRASEVMNYSQSGISRMICDLEKEWKVRLLERCHTGVKPTSEGLRLLPYAKAICRNFEEMQMEVDGISGLTSGLIRIGTFSSVATHWLPRIISAFQRDYPGMDYEILLGDYPEISKWISEGQADCGFLSMSASDGLEAVYLDRDDFLAVLPEGHRLAGMDPVPLAELAREPFMMLQKGGKAEVAEIFAGSGLTPNIRFTTWDDYAIMSMVENGLGVSILPELILKRIPYSIAARKLDVPAFREIGLAVRSREQASAAVKKFFEYLPYRNDEKKRSAE